MPLWVYRMRAVACIENTSPDGVNTANGGGGARADGCHQEPASAAKGNSSMSLASWASRRLTPVKKGFGARTICAALYQGEFDFKVVDDGGVQAVGNRQTQPLNEEFLEGQPRSEE